MSNQPYNLTVPKLFLVTLSQIFDIERKIKLHGDSAGISRNIERLKDTFADEQFFYEDPMGQPFDETRTDLEASIAGEGADNLVVTEVIKPIIRFGKPEFSRVIQKGIVVVQSRAVAPDATGTPDADQQTGKQEGEQA